MEKLLKILDGLGKEPVMFRQEASGYRIGSFDESFGGYSKLAWELRVNSLVSLLPAADTYNCYRLTAKEMANFLRYSVFKGALVTGDDTPFFDADPKCPNSVCVRDILNVSHAMSDDETRLFMMGVQVEERGDLAFAVATDGRRMALSGAINLDNPVTVKGCFLRPLAIKLLKHFSSQLLWYTEQDRSGGGFASVSLIDKDASTLTLTLKYEANQFPNYPRVIPDYLPGAKPLEILPGTLDLLKEEKKRVRAIEGGRVAYVSVTLPTLAVDRGNSPTSPRFNVDYLIEALKYPVTTYYQRDPGEALVLFKEGEHMEIIMPARKD